LLECILEANEVEEFVENKDEVEELVGNEEGEELVVTEEEFEGNENATNENEQAEENENEELEQNFRFTTPISKKQPRFLVDGIVIQQPKFGNISVFLL
jgi:hypothetical protein